MTDAEAIATRELVYIAKEIAQALADNPTKPARMIAGDADNPDDELARLFRAINTVGKLVFPAWGHRHPDEIGDAR
jgi:hypothetical protein